MRKIIAIAGLLFGLYSCENRENLFEKYNDNPIIKVEKQREYVEELKDSLKIGFDMSYKMIIQDEGEVIIDIDEIEGGEIILKDNNDTLHFGQSIIPCKGNMLFKANSVGLVVGRLIMTDMFGAKKIFNFELKAFDNARPKCKLSVTKIPEYSQYETVISLEESFDPDERFGGGIIEYEYRIGNYYTLKTTEFKKINHIFPGPGTYMIKCRVKDSNNAWSDYVYSEVKFD